MDVRLIDKNKEEENRVENEQKYNWDRMLDYVRFCIFSLIFSDLKYSFFSSYSCFGFLEMKVSD